MGRRHFYFDTAGYHYLTGTDFILYFVSIMSTESKLYLIFSELDKSLALELVQKLQGIEVWISPITNLVSPGQEIENYQNLVLVFLLTSQSYHDKLFQFQMKYALENKIVIIPVQVQQCNVPQIIQNIIPFNYEDFLTRQRDKFFEMAGISQWVNKSKSIVIDESPAHAYPPYHAPSQSNPTFPAQSKARKSIFKSIIESINPFKKSGEKSIDDYRGMTIGRSAVASAGRASKEVLIGSPAPQSSSGSEPESPSAIEPLQGIDTRLSSKIDSYVKTTIGGRDISEYFPDKEPTIPKHPNEAPGKGKVLYDIPDTMTVNMQQKCVVRVGKTEAIVLDDDSFSPAVQIETIPISKVMEVDIVDISDPPRFNIKKISSVEQFVDEDSYSEWIFMVTPLSGGEYPLLLKVSVIKIIDGKACRKELVFTRSVNISAAAPVATGPSLIMPFVSENPLVKTNEPVLKDLVKEKDVKEYDPPAVFISYAHNDKTYFDIFIQYLQDHSGWKIWTDRNIEIGSGWYQSIQSSIKESDIAVLLISANFISSGFIREHEYEQFSKLQATKNDFKFLPLLLRDVDFTRWQDLAAMQIFVAYGDEYGVPEKRGVMIPFAKLCRFDNNSQLIPNDNIDTYFKNLVKKAEKDWLILKTGSLA